jgi:tellurium resistance protein TerD
MTISLVKGGNISLSKEAPDLKLALIGLGWDPRSTDGQSFDLDASIFLLNDTGKVRSDADFIFYNQKKSTDGSVEHLGDNKTGAGTGDDEQVRIDLAKVSADIKRIVFSVTIHEADQRRQNFGQVANAYIRVLNAEGEAQIARYDLSEDSATETAMIFGEVYRHNDEWKFKAIGQGFAGGLSALAKNYGVNI